MDEVIHLPNELLPDLLATQIAESVDSFKDYRVYKDQTLDEYDKTSKYVKAEGIPSLMVNRHFKEDNLEEHKYYVGPKYLKTCLQMDPQETFACLHNHLYKLLGTKYCDDLKDCLSKKFSTRVKISGRFVYPDTQGFMGWHTNSRKGRNPLRIYITYTKESGKSFFRYINKKGEMVTDYDNQGFTIRAFHPGSFTSPFWHCVYSGDITRLSYGFKVRELTMDAFQDIGFQGPNTVTEQINLHTELLNNSQMIRN